jgi:hypothetical protein
MMHMPDHKDDTDKERASKIQYRMGMELSRLQDALYRRNWIIGASLFFHLITTFWIMILIKGS